MTLEQAIEGLSDEELDLLNSDAGMLAEFKAKYETPEGLSSSPVELMGDLTPGTASADVTVQDTGPEKTMFQKLTSPEPFYTAGKGVEAGYAGLADLATGKDLATSAGNVENVMAEKPLTTKSSKVGKFAGSFFTPIQIALQGLTMGLAGPAVKSAEEGAEILGKAVARNSDVAIPAAQKGSAEVISALTGAEPEALQQVMLNKDAVIKAASFPELAEQVAGAMNKLGEHIGKLDDTANAFLRSEVTESTKPILDAIQSARQTIGNAALPEVADAQAMLTALEQQIAGKGGMMSEKSIVEWLKSLRKGINWNDPTGQLRSQALSKVQGIVNDGIKALNPRYAEAEAKLAESIGLRDGVEQAMGLVKKAGQKAWSVKDVSVAKLKGLLSPESRAATIGLMEEMSKIPGVPNFVEMAKTTAAKTALAEPATGAHRMFGLGTRLPALGGVLAGLVPAAGRAASGTLDFGIKAAPAAANAVYQGLIKERP